MKVSEYFNKDNDPIERIIGPKIKAFFYTKKEFFFKQVIFLNKRVFFTLKMFLNTKVSRNSQSLETRSNMKICIRKNFNLYAYLEKTGYKS